jgi:hypothetical protein
MKWSITPGLPGVFGARFVLRMWFPMQQPGSSNSSSSSNQQGPATRFLLLPSDSTDSNASYTTYAPDVGIFAVQPIQSVQAIVHLQPQLLAQRFSSDDTNQQDDYSFTNTPIIDAKSTDSNNVRSSNSSGNGTTKAKLIRHAVRPNARLVALLNSSRAWGSPPTGQLVGIRALILLPLC